MTLLTGKETPHENKRSRYKRACMRDEIMITSYNMYKNKKYNEYIYTNLTVLFLPTDKFIKIQVVLVVTDKGGVRVRL